MKICVLTAIIALALTQSCVSAGEEKDENNLVTTYTGETTSEIPISPRLPHYGEITADDQPDHHPENQGHIRFEEDPTEPPVNLDNTKVDQFQDQFPEFNKPSENFDLENISFEGDQNDRILTPNDQFDSGEPEHKVFDEPLPISLYPEVPGIKNNKDNDNLELENDAKKTSFDDDERSDEDDQDFEDEKTNLDNLEDPDDEQPTNSKEESGSDKSNDTERIAFEDDQKTDTQLPVRKKTRTPRRKPRVQILPKDKSPMPHNTPMPGYNYPGFPGAGYYPGPVDPNSEYPGYPHGYPTAYPGGFPGYPTPYPAPPYHTQAYLGYSPYQPGYPGSYPGYPPYPSYPSPDSRPQTNTQDQDTQADSKYPSHVHPGSNSGGQSGHRRPSDRYPGQGYEAGYSSYPAQSGYPTQPAYPGQSGYPGYDGYRYFDPTGQYGQYRPYAGYTGYYRPQHRPKSLTQRALSAVAEALTSIALFDDKQCVPRLLCEVASGSTLTSPTLQKATAGLGPLLAVLQSYNGVSSSPLFLFGKAAVLGMTTKGNPTTCRFAYPQCPNDPEGLLNYLNHHNGGFFRFFGQPEGENQPQNLEQFYNHLAGQYGSQTQQQSQQQTQSQQLTQQQQQNYLGYPYGYYMHNPYGSSNYRLKYYHEHNNYRNSKDTDHTDNELAHSIIQERIQNKPGIIADEDIEEDKKEQGSAWTFPDEVSNKKREDKSKRRRKERAKNPKVPERDERGGGALKFPDEKGPINDIPNVDEDKDFVRKRKVIFFPGDNNFNPQTNYQPTSSVNLNEYVFDYKHNFYVKRPKAVKNDDAQTVYIVRGNGDPNHPEIVKVRPGESALKSEIINN